MSSLYAMRRANGDWFALDERGRLRVPVFGSRWGGMLARVSHTPKSCSPVKAFEDAARRGERSRNKMPTVASTHSIKQNATRVYHNNSRCAERNNIEAGAVRHGTGGRPLCVHCCSLKAQGK